MTTISGYLGTIKTLVDQVSEQQIEHLTDALFEAWKSGSRVFLIGNGGSSSTASHIVADLQKCIQLECGTALKALCLSDSTPLVTAWANDTEFSRIFAGQVEAWAQEGDLLIAISGSGNSPNVITAVETANRLGVRTIGLAGYAGGKLAQTAQECIVVRSNNMQQIEDLHMIVLHLVFSLLRDKVSA